MNSASTAFSVRFLKNGDNVSYQQNVSKQNGDGTTLLQIIDVTSGVISPNWSVAANQPIITLVPLSANGFPVTTTGVTWTYDGVELEFTLDGTTWVSASNDNRFKARINSEGFYELRIVDNLISSSNLGNRQIDYAVSYRSNGKNGSFEGTATVMLQDGGSQSHIVTIGVQALDTANNRGGMTLGRIAVENSGSVGYVEINQTTLTASAYYGAEAITIGQNNYGIDWYRDGVLLTGSETGITISGANLTVTRAAVDGGSIFVAKLKKSSTVVAQDSQRIIDNADEYQIVAIPVSNQNFVSYENSVETNAVYTLAVTKNNQSMSQEGVNFAWDIYNANGTHKRPGTGATVTVTPADCLIAGSSITASDAQFGDADVRVTATF